jgi:hypothetical protein
VIAWAPTEAEYRADPAVSSTGLAVFRDEGPAAYHGKVVTGEIEPTAPRGHLAIGIRLHELVERSSTGHPVSVLDPQTLRLSSVRLVEVLSGGKPLARRSGRAWKDAVAGFGADSLILTHEMELADAMFAALQLGRTPQETLAQGLMAGDSEHEFVHRWMDATGLVLKCRWDLVSENTGQFWDVKSYGKPLPSAEVWRRYVETWGAVYQLALYAIGFRDRFGTLPRCGWIVASKVPPHEWAVFEWPLEDLKLAIRRVEKDLRRLAACYSTDRWFTAEQAETRPIQMEASRWWRRDHEEETYHG